MVLPVNEPTYIHVNVTTYYAHLSTHNVITYPITPPYYPPTPTHTYTPTFLHHPLSPPLLSPPPSRTHTIQNAGVDPCNVCPKGTICRTEPVFCINPPCGPDRVRCLDLDEICILEPETGPCRASFRRFFYNSTTDQCELFIYGGCGGNDNRFDTRSECISAFGMWYKYYCLFSLE